MAGFIQRSIYAAALYHSFFIIVGFAVPEKKYFFGFQFCVNFASQISSGIFPWPFGHRWAGFLLFPLRVQPLLYPTGSL